MINTKVRKKSQNFGYLIRWKCDWCWIITCADTAIAFNLATEWPPSSGDFIIKPLTVRFCPTYIILSTAYVWPFLSLSTILWWCNLHGSHLYMCWKMDSYVPHSQLLTLFLGHALTHFSTALWSLILYQFQSWWSYAPWHFTLLSLLSLLFHNEYYVIPVISPSSTQHKHWVRGEGGIKLF